MKKTLSTLLSLLLSIVVLIINVEIVGAQTDCGNQGGYCQDSNIGCGPNEEYKPTQECDNLSDGVNNFSCCVPKAPPPVCPGTCRNACISGETSGGQQNCPNSSPICCLVSGTKDLYCPGTNKLDTAIGCIDITNSTELIGFILKWAIGIGGGVAFLLILYSSFMIMTSQGVPERLKAGQELLTSAIMGLILLIFSVFILKLIGIDILNIKELSI